MKINAKWTEQQVSKWHSQSVVCAAHDFGVSNENTTQSKSNSVFRINTFLCVCVCINQNKTMATIKNYQKKQLRTKSNV